MAEQEGGGQEKTEQPSAKKIEDARKKGQIPRSKETATAAVTMAGAAVLLLTGPWVASRFETLFRELFQIEREALYQESTLWISLVNALWTGLAAFVPFFMAVTLAGIAGSVMLGGWNLSWEAIAIKWDRLNPAEGMKRIFSLKGLMELVKALAKFSVIALLAIAALYLYRESLMGLAAEPSRQGIAHGVILLGWCLLLISAGLIVIAVVDAPFQQFQFMRQMRMTRQELKDEFKETEGRPEVKSKIRQLQMEVAQRRMMEEVPQADVVITNPTHFSVALKYDQSRMRAPVVVAKGVDQIALKIREIANEHQVAMLEAPPLARSIYFTTELDEEIPEGLYLAVAQVLAYVYQVKRWQAGQGQKPAAVSDLPIPVDLMRNADGQSPQ